MEIFTQGLYDALCLLLSGDSEVWAVTLLTIRVSGTATLISVLIGLPLGVFLGLKEFPGKTVIVSLINTAMGLPPVVVGLVVSILVWRNGPLGYLGIMYTTKAMIIAQAIIASPVIAGFAFAAIGQISPGYLRQLHSLGASRMQAFWWLIWEARLSLLAAVIAGFGAVISEVGASMMVGGNVKGDTRVLTTATVMEVSKGNFDLALSISIILLLLTYSITASLTVLQQRRLPH